MKSHNLIQTTFMMLGLSEAVCQHVLQE